MFNLHITARMALLLLKRAVEDRGPDHVEQSISGSCVYVKEADESGALTPSCIVAQVFAYLGVLRALVGNEACAAPVPNNKSGVPLKNQGALRGIRPDLADKGITFSDEAFELLVNAQIHQDSQVRWGLAVTRAAEALLKTRGVSTDAVETALLVLSNDEG